MEAGTSTSDALIVLLDALYEEYRDDLPPLARLPINLVRKAANRMTGTQLRALRTATQGDVEQAWRQSKLATEYAAHAVIELKSLAQAFDDFRRAELPALAQAIEDLGEKVEARNLADADAEAARRIEMAKDLREKAKVAEARAYLGLTRRELWAQMSDHHRYRVLAELGLCEDHDGHHEAAAELFLEAKTYDPTNNRARGLEAVAYMMLGQRSKAHELAGLVLHENPTLDVAAQVWVRTAPDDEAFEALEGALLESVRTNAGVACALAERAVAIGRRPAALNYVRQALADAMDAPDVLSVCAQLLFQIETSSDRHVRAVEPLNDPQGLLHEAANHITAALERLGPQGPPIRIAALRVNRALIRDALGQPNRARRDLEHALDVTPVDEEVRLAYWRHLFFRGEYDEALDVTRPDTVLNDSHRLLFAHAVTRRARNAEGDQDACLQIAQRIHDARPTPLDTTAVDTVELIVELYCQRGEHDEARRVLHDVHEQLPDGLRILFDGYVFHAEGGISNAEESARAAAEHVDTDGEHKVVFRVADFMKRLGLHEEAFPYWRALSPPDCVGPLTYEVLNCAYKCHKFEFVRNFCKDLRQNGYVDSTCLEVELQVYEDLGATTEAIDSIREALAYEESPTRAACLRLWLSIAGLRLGKKDLMTSDPAALPDVEDVDPQMGALVVEVLRQAGRSADALDYAYRLLRRHPSREIAHQSIISLIFLARDLRRPRPSSVVAGVAVGYEDSRTGEVEWRVIEDETKPPPGIYQDELAPTDPVAVALNGASVGDEVTLSTDAVGDRTARVLGVADKRFHRAWVCLRHFERRFPMSGFVRGIKVIDEKTGEADFSEVVAIMQAHDQHAEHVLDVYDKHPACPAYLAAERAGDSLPAFVERLARNGRRLRCCQGTAVERDRAMASIRMAGGVVIDSSALLTLFLCDSIATLKAVRDPVVVTEATYVWLRELRDTLFGEGGARLRIAQRDGKLVSHEWDEESREKASADLLEMLNWLQPRIESGFVLAKVDARVQEQTREVLGVGTAQSVALAANRQYVLWTDDFATGMLASHQFHVERVWTQVVASDAVSRGDLSASQFYDVCLGMMQYRYWFIWMNLEMIQYGLEEAEYDPDRWPANRLLEVLGDPDATLPYLEPLLKLLIDKFRSNRDIEMLLTRLFHKLHSRPGGDQILRRMREQLIMICGLDVISQAKLEELIDSTLVANRNRIVLPSPVDILRLGRLGGG